MGDRGSLGREQSASTRVRLRLAEPSREITSRLRLRWGSYRGRYLAGLALIVSGAMAVQGGNSYALFVIVQGSCAFFIGWAVMPAGGARRVWMVVPAYIGAFAQLAGPQCAPAMVLPFVAWLVVRRRSGRSYLAVIPLLLVTVAVANTFREVAQMTFTTPVVAVAVFACAWLARRLDGRLAAIPIRTDAHRSGNNAGTGSLTAQG